MVGTVTVFLEMHTMKKIELVVLRGAPSLTLARSTK